MNRRRAGIAALCLLLGIAVVLSVPYRVWRPTVAAPNYWENHTGGLLPLVLQAALGGLLVVVGFALGFDTVARRLRATGIRTSGLLAVAGGLLGSGVVDRVLAETFGTRVVSFGVGAGAWALLIVGVAGVVARYPLSGRRGRWSAGVLAGGLSLLAGAKVLRWGLTTVEPRTGALSYPPLGVSLVGTLALAVGSVLLGVSLRGRGDTPRWLGPVLVLAGVISVPLGALAFMQYEEAIGLYGLAWVVVGAHLAVNRANTADRVGSRR